MSADYVKSVAIMQPTFLPWIGYFSLLDSVDEFIFLDHVQFEKRSWQQRNKIRNSQGEQWLSVPVRSKGKQKQLIKDVHISYDNMRRPLDKIMKTIETNYKKAPFYNDYYEDLNLILSKNPKHISKLNQDIIQWVCSKLQIITPCILSSEIGVVGARADLLVDICKVKKATHYISPLGSKVYLDETNAFELAGIPISYYNFKHPEYQQLHGGFIPYLSILDLLFNAGPDSRAIMKEGAD
jgi:hypothetical protein